MRRAIRLAKRAHGETSPNPLVGAVLVKGDIILGQGWHHRAGQPHAEIEAIRDAEKRGSNIKSATLYVTLEPCCTHGRTPPCTDAIIAAGIKRVVVAATDPNPHHAGKGFDLLQRAGIEVISGIEAKGAEAINESFNHWIVHRTPFITVKAAMTLDGKIATSSGESKWITGEKARAYGMKLRKGADVILAGINTILFDDPGLTIRDAKPGKGKALRRLILDPRAQTPLTAQVVSDEFASRTTIITTELAAAKRVSDLDKQVQVLKAPLKNGRIDLRWLLKKLGKENVTNLLVEGGGETNAQFLEQGLAHRVAFFYAPKIIGGRDARKGVAGTGLSNVAHKISLTSVEYKILGDDLLLTARVA
ncbi:MAG: bifunctional diaminohydroxyphosphoribosylaminopyrimidine deaminase/5-amino-6-(5-phosphoribosylamino)uracil reductase RibD [Verrucomicrobia bacterium]|nr:bifunctional diaminohydroxyphosphoribosylaminopyrimidine deaminase/5-amino-6-(5-phosphoribosylamino)uracil reductase RibD [Verrucomicrobiota bacterium]